MSTLTGTGAVVLVVAFMRCPSRNAMEEGYRFRRREGFCSGPGRQRMSRFLRHALETLSRRLLVAQDRAQELPGPRLLGIAEEALRFALLHDAALVEEADPVRHLA